MGCNTSRSKERTILRQESELEYTNTLDTRVLEPTKVIRQYSYCNDYYGKDRPYFIVIEDRTPGTGYKLAKFLTDNRIRTWVNAEGTIKMWFNPEHFPSFEYVAARLSVTPPDQLVNALTELLYEHSVTKQVSSPSTGEPVEREKREKREKRKKREKSAVAPEDRKRKKHRRRRRKLR